MRLWVSIEAMRFDEGGWSMTRAGVHYGFLLACWICVGCGCQAKPNSAEVSGVVTLDGKPLAKADVIFTPEVGRPSFGITNAEGEYALMFTGTKMGAIPGSHRVSIMTGVEGADSVGIRTKEIVPAKYRGPESELIEEVKPGRNTINFSLHTR